MITFTIPGEARGKGRPRFARRGNFVKTYTDSKTVSFENLVALFASQAMGARPLIEGPASVRMDIHVGIPASWSKKKRADALAGNLRPTGKPDLDNCAKLTLDALNGVVWRDDKQVAALTVTKQYAETPRTEVAVQEMRLA